MSHKKTKHTLGIAAFLVLLESILRALGDVIIRYGKEIAVWYLFLLIWAVGYLISLSSEENKREIRNLELENERLNQKLRDISNNSPQE